MEANRFGAIIRLLLVRLLHILIGQLVLLQGPKQGQLFHLLLQVALEAIQKPRNLAHALLIGLAQNSVAA